jgi:S-layer homology domain.
MKKRILSALLALVMIVSALPAQAFAAMSATAQNNDVENQAILEELKRLTGSDAEAEGIMRTMTGLGLLSENGDLVSKSVIIDGRSHTLDEVQALLTGKVNLSQPVNVDGFALTLGELKTMLEIEDELLRIEQTYFNSDMELTPEHLITLQSLQTQLETTGLELPGQGMLAAPAVASVSANVSGSGIDHNVRVTMAVQNGHSSVLTATNTSFNVVFSIPAATTQDIAFKVRLVDGAAKTGTHVEALTSNSLTIPAGSTSVSLQVKYKGVGSLDTGELGFVVEAYDISENALFAGGTARTALTGSVSMGGGHYADLNIRKSLEQLIDSGLTALERKTALALCNEIGFNDGTSTFNEREPAYPDGWYFSHVTLTTNKGTFKQGNFPSYGSNGLVGTSHGQLHSAEFRTALLAADFDATKMVVQTDLANGTVTKYNSWTYPGTPSGPNETFMADQYRGKLTVSFYDSQRPTVLFISAPAGTYGPGSIVPVTVEFSEPVSGGTATINDKTCFPIEQEGNGASRFRTYQYVVEAGDNTGLNLAKITGAKDMRGNTMSDHAPANSTLTGISIQALDLATAVRSSVLAVEKSIYAPADAAAVVTLTLPQNQALAELFTTNQDLHSGQLYLSVDGGTTKIPLIAILEGQAEVLTGFTATIPLPANTTNTSYVAELYTVDGNQLVYGTYAAFQKQAAVLIASNNLAIVMPGNYPTETVFADEMPAASALKLAVSLNGSGYTWGNISKVGVYDAAGNPPEGDFDFAWKSSNPGMAVIDESGQITLTRASGEAEITLVAFNGGVSQVESASVQLSVKTGYQPFLEIMETAQKITIRSGADAIVSWSSNLVEKNHEASPSAETTFTVTVHATDVNGQKSDEPITTETLTVSQSMPAPLPSSLAISGLDRISANGKPSYIATVEASSLPDVPGGQQTFTAEAEIYVISKPALVELTRPTSLYITDKSGTVSVPWRVENFDIDNQAEFKLTATDNATGQIIGEIKQSELTSGNPSGIFSFPIVGGSFRNIYTVELWAKNTSDPTWSYDSFVLYVYDENALQISKNGALVTGSEITLSNEDWVAGLSQEEIIDLSRNILLQAELSAYTGNHIWSEVRDRIQWCSGNNVVSSVNYKVGSFYENITDLPYDSYAPTASFSLSGNKDGSTQLTAVHAFVGEELSKQLTVNVETLKDKLYLFQLSPAVETTLRYGNKTVVSNENGEAAVYEENGINAPIYLSSIVGGETYFGTIHPDKLVSQEPMVTSLNLYPLNTFTLRQAASVPMRFVDESGSSFTGSIQVRAGVFRNGEYCPDVVIDNMGDGVGVGTDYTINPDSTGSYTFRFDINQFTTATELDAVAASDSLRFCFEIRPQGQYPQILVVNGNMSEQSVIRSGERIVTLSALPANTEIAELPPFVNRQVVYFNAQATGLSSDVTGTRGKLGPSAAYKNLTLSTVTLWPNTEETDIDRYAVQAVDSFGIPLAGQSSTAFRYPFSTITMVENQVLLNNNTLTQWGLSLPTMAKTLELKYTDGATVTKNEQTSLRIVNMSDYDPTEGPELLDKLSNMRTLMSGNEFGGLGLGGGLIELGLSFSSAANVDVGVFKLVLAPTADPTVYHGLLSLGIDNMNNDNVSKLRTNEEEITSDLDYMPGLAELNALRKGQLFEHMDQKFNEVKYAASLLKANVTSGISGYVKTTDKSPTYTLTGHCEVEIYYDFEKGAWQVNPMHGNFTAGGGLNYDWIYNAQVGPVPVIAELGLGAAVQYRMDIARDNVQNDTDYLSTLRINAYFRAFGGLGFDYSVIALKIGLYGQVDFDAQLRWLNKIGSDRAEFAYNIKLQGEVGISFKAKLLFLSYERILWSQKIAEKDWITDNWSSVQTYWDSVSEGKSGNADVIIAPGRAQVRTLAFDAGLGIALYESPATERLESRDYLGAYERQWYSGPKISLFSLDTPNAAPEALQTNAYPYANPTLSEDGALLLYFDDQGVEDVTKTRVAYATKNANGTYDQGQVLSDDGFGDAQLSLAGDNHFAVAAWTRMSEDKVKKEPGSEITPDEQALMMSAAEIATAVYVNGSWSTTMLTQNYSPDMAPVVAANGDTALVAWRSVSSSDSADLVNFNAEDQILYRIYSGGQWNEPQTLYNGTSGAVKGIDAAMLEDGTTAITYVIDRKGEQSATDLEVVYGIVDNSGDVLRNVQLTSDNNIDENPKLATVKLDAEGEPYFVLAWHSVEDVDGRGKHDLRLAAFDAVGNLNPGFIDSLSDLVRNMPTNLTSNFQFSKNAKTLGQLSILWVEPALEVYDRSDGNTTFEERDQLTALRFSTQDGLIYTTAAQQVAEMAAGTAIDSFDAYVQPDGTMKAIILGTSYDFENLTQVGTATDGEGKQTVILVPATVSGMYTATMIYTDGIHLDAVLPDYAAIRTHAAVPIQFSVINEGTVPVNKLRMEVGNEVFLFEGEAFAAIYPGESRTLTIMHPLGDVIADASYTITPYFGSLGEKTPVSGTVYLDVPDLGISTLEVLSAADGNRVVNLAAYNDSDSYFASSERKVAIGLFTDAAATTLVDAKYFTPVNVAEGEKGTLDAATYSTQFTFNLEGYASDNAEDFLTEAGEIRNGGITLYARIWAEDSVGDEVTEFMTQNNMKSITFEGLLGDSDTSVAITSILGSSGGNSVAVIDLQNNSLNNIATGNLIVSLLDEKGNVLETKQSYAGGVGLITLNGEEQSRQSFQFSKVGASVQTMYSDLILNEPSAELSALSFSGIPVRLADFVQDGGDVYKAEVSIKYMENTVVLAATKSPDATVTMNGTAGLSQSIPLTRNGKTVITILVTADDGEIRTYELSVICLAEYSGGSSTSEPKKPEEKEDENITIPFTDVHEQDWFYTAVAFAYRNGLVSGISETNFGPDMSLTRSMLMTILARLDGVDTAASDPWYVMGMNWAVDAGISDGTAPMANISREQLVTMLYRYALRQGYASVESQQEQLKPFADADNVSVWAQDAMAWAVEHQLIEGKGNGHLDPLGEASRAEVVTILMRFIETFSVEVEL